MSTTTPQTEIYALQLEGQNCVTACVDVSRLEWMKSAAQSKETVCASEGLIVLKWQGRLTTDRLPHFKGWLGSIVQSLSDVHKRSLAFLFPLAPNRALSIVCEPKNSPEISIIVVP